MSGITDFMLVVVLEGDPARGLCLLGLCVPDQGALLHFPAWQRMSSPEHPLLEKKAIFPGNEETVHCSELIQILSGRPLQ